MSETHDKRTPNARETYGLEAGCDFELDGPDPMSDLPIEERIGAWMEWAGYLKQRIRDHYRPRIAELEAEVQRLKVEVRNAKFRSYNDLRKRAERAEALLADHIQAEAGLREQLGKQAKRAQSAEGERDDYKAELSAVIFSRDEWARAERQARAYADELAAGLPCLPEDVELLRKANADMAAEVSNLNDECVRLTELMERAEKLAVEEGVKRAEAEEQLAETVGALREKLAAKDRSIADLERIVGKQEEDIDALEMRVRELELTP